MVLLSAPVLSTDEQAAGKSDVTTRPGVVVLTFRRIEMVSSAGQRHGAAFDRI